MDKKKIRNDKWLYAYGVLFTGVLLMSLLFFGPINLIITYLAGGVGSLLGSWKKRDNWRTRVKVLLAWLPALLSNRVNGWVFGGENK